MRIRTIVAVDDASTLSAISQSIEADPELHLAGSAEDADQAIALCLAGNADVLLLHIGMPRGGARRVARTVRSQCQSVAIVALTSDATPATVGGALSMGALACAMRTEPIDTILDAVRRAGQGQVAISRALAASALEEFSRRGTEHARNVARLHAVEQRLHTLDAVFDAAPDGFVVVDADGLIRLVNATAERMFGYGPGELAGRTVEELVPEPLSELHASHRFRYTVDPRPRSIGAGTGLVARRKDGTELLVEIGLSPLDCNGGRLVVAAVRESVRHVRSEAPVDERQLFRLLVESSPDGTVIVGADGRIELVNSELEAMFDYPDGQLLGQRIEVLVPARHRREHVEQRARYQDHPRARPIGLGMDLVGRRRDGSEFPVDISLAPLPGPKGARTVARVRDLTQRRRAERQLMLSNLVRAQEDERVRIAADIHDDTIQTVTAAGLRLERLAGRLTDDSQREELEKVRTAVRDSISRLRHLMFNLRPPTLAEEGLVASLRICLALFEAETGIHADLVTPIEQEPPLETSMLLYRAAQELLTNVSKHAMAKSVRVEVHERDGGYELIVADDGRGFEGGRAVTRPGHLGLVGLRERAELAGGWCRFDGEPGQGVTAAFWLPGVDPGGLDRRPVKEIHSEPTVHR